MCNICLMIRLGDRTAEKMDFAAEFVTLLQDGSVYDQLFLAKKGHCCSEVEVGQCWR